MSIAGINMLFTYEEQFSTRMEEYGKKYLRPASGKKGELFDLDCRLTYEPHELPKEKTKFLRSISNAVQYIGYYIIGDLVSMNAHHQEPFYNLDREAGEFFDMITEAHEVFRQILRAKYAPMKWDKSFMIVSSLMEYIDRMCILVGAGDISHHDRIKSMTLLLKDLEIKFVETTTKFEGYTAIIHFKDFLENMVLCGNVDRFMFMEQFDYPTICEGNEEFLGLLQFDEKWFNIHAYEHYLQKGIIAPPQHSMQVHVTASSEPETSNQSSKSTVFKTPAPGIGEELESGEDTTIFERPQHLPLLNAMVTAVPVPEPTGLYNDEAPLLLNAAETAKETPVTSKLPDSLVVTSASMATCSAPSVGDKPQTSGSPTHSSGSIMSIMPSIVRSMRLLCCVYSNADSDN